MAVPHFRIPASRDFVQFTPSYRCSTCFFASRSLFRHDQFSGGFEIASLQIVEISTAGDTLALVISTVPIGGFIFGGISPGTSVAEL
jgi:hypothetical protein